MYDLHGPLIEPLEGRVMLSRVPNDPGYRYLWNLQESAAGEAWERTTGAASVVVANVDSGVDYTHPDLYRNIWINAAEIPSRIRKSIKDADGDGVITFRDLNDPANEGKAADWNANGGIDGQDLLRPFVAGPKGGSKGGWADGVNGRTYKGDRYVDDIIGWDFADGDNDPMDHNGHGTHTAGTIAAMGNNSRGVTGAAWDASVMAVKIFTDAGEGASANQIAQAIRYSVNAGARVSNNSWGYSFASRSRAIFKAIKYARSHEHVFVVAAGNDGVDNDRSNWKSYPASFGLPNIISVGATDSQGRLTYFSNYGKYSVDLAAPGIQILSTLPGGRYGYRSGTSMATPLVSGAVALMLSANPGLSHNQVRSALIEGSDQTPMLMNGVVSGGVVNIANAVDGVQGQRYAPPAEQPPVRFIIITIGGRRYLIPVDEWGNPVYG